MPPLLLYHNHEPLDYHFGLSLSCLLRGVHVRVFLTKIVGCIPTGSNTYPAKRISYRATCTSILPMKAGHNLKAYDVSLLNLLCEIINCDITSFGRTIVCATSTSPDSLWYNSQAIGPKAELVHYICACDCVKGVCPYMIINMDHRRGGNGNATMHSTYTYMQSVRVAWDSTKNILLHPSTKSCTYRG